jgi:ferredoxin-NADP reductase
VLLSAGVGATPVLAMLHQLVHERSDRPVWWIHGARDVAQHAFGPEADALIAQLADAHRLVAYSQATSAAAQGKGYDMVGRLDVAALERARVPEDAEDL